MKKEMVVGTVFLLAMVLLIVFTVVISDWRPWGETQSVIISFENIAGLREGDEVQLAGAVFGRVRSINLEDGRVMVCAALHKPVTLHEGCSARIRSVSPLGGRMVSIDPGDTDKPELAPDAVIPGTHLGANMVDGINDLVAEIKGGEGTVAKLIRDPEVYNNIRDFTETLKGVSERIDKGDGFLGKMLAQDSGKFYDDAAETAETLKRIVKGVEDGKGTLGKLVADDSLYNSVDKTFANAEAISDGLAAGEGTIGKLLKEDTLHENLDASFANVREITDQLKTGEGAAGELIYNKQMGEDLAAAIADAKKVAAKAASGEGTIGKLLNDPSLFDDAKSMVDALSGLAGDVAKGEGTLGKLLTDPSLYNEAKELVAQLRQAAEDAREQAPVTAFGNVLLGGFR